MGLLYACGVRRLKDLLRVCLRFSSSLSFFSSFSSLVLLLLCLPPLLVLFPAFPLLSVLVSFVAFVVVSFSLTDYTQKKRRKGFAPCVLSSCVVCVKFLYSYKKIPWPLLLLFPVRPVGTPS